MRFQERDEDTARLACLANACIEDGSVQAPIRLHVGVKHLLLLLLAGHIAAHSLGQSTRLSRFIHLHSKLSSDIL